MIGSTGRAVKARHRKVFTVPVTSGNYATQVITIGVPADATTAPMDYAGVTVLMEGAPVAGCQAELWLPRVTPEPDGKAVSALDPVTDYYHSGQVVCPVGTAASPTGATASFGSLTYALAGWPGCQVRVKSGGVSGSVTVSVVAF